MLNCDARRPSPALRALRAWRLASDGRRASSVAVPKFISETQATPQQQYQRMPESEESSQSSDPIQPLEPAAERASPKSPQRECHEQSRDSSPDPSTDIASQVATHQPADRLLESPTRPAPPRPALPLTRVGPRDLPTYVTS